MVKTTIAAIRGMNDVLPDETIYWQYLEETFRELANSYSYREIRTPIVENSSLFKRSIGELTDIVEKETYTFDDRNGDSLTLRPEGTASVVRAGIEHSLFYKQVQRLWYMGPYFRRERPQKGRYRQFYQLGLEAFGMSGPDIDIEMLFLVWRFWQDLGLAEHISLQINTLGLFAERKLYRDVLIAYFEKHRDKLDEDSLRRLHKNPLRILDSKNSSMQSLIEDAPSIHEYLGSESGENFQAICKALDVAGIAYTVNPRLVRGLDYYCHTVFEWVSDELGAQGTVCAGGRYDGLVATVGGENIPAVGFAMGIERIILLLKQHGLQLQAMPDVYIISSSGFARNKALLLAEKIHTDCTGIKVLNHCGEGAFKSQIKKADKSGAKIALILGEDEMSDDTVSIKYLREKREQMRISQTSLIEHLNKIFN